MSERRGIWSPLASPFAYETFHHLIGARRWLKRFAREVIRARSGDRVLDIGCGPGALLRYLPGTAYIGFDRNEAYIAHAKRIYGDRGQFICDDVINFADHAFPPVDIAVAIGILHHLNDELALRLLRATFNTLKPTGRLISVDPCYHPEQSLIQRFVASHDRGMHVRPFSAYPELFSSTFAEPRAEFQSGYLPFPQSICIVEAVRCNEVGSRMCLPRWKMGDKPRILVITPAHNEAHNLLELHRRIARALEAMQWCWLLVDDRSDDDTFAIADVLSRQDERVAAIRFGARVGTHAALLAALRLAAGWEFAAAAVLGADLEDPPEALPDLISAWRRGAEVVFAARMERTGVPLLHRTIGGAIHGAVRVALPRSQYPWCGTDMGVFGRLALSLLAKDPRPVGNVFVRIACLHLPSAIVPLAKHKKPQGWSREQARVLAGFAARTVGEACGLRVFAYREIPSIEATLGWAHCMLGEAAAVD
jgi:SAM-dependent methyltransferase